MQRLGWALTAGAAIACSAARHPDPDPAPRPAAAATLGGLETEEPELGGEEADLAGGQVAESVETLAVVTGVAATAPSDGRHDWRLRGDWESGNSLLVAYDAEWEDELVELIRAATGDVEVYVLATREELTDHRFYAWLGRHSASVVVAEHDTPWVRDYGPFQVRADDGSVGWLDFQYSVDRLLDDRVPAELAETLGVSVSDHVVWLDGGAVVSNGAGLCGVTDVSLGTTGLDPTDASAVTDFMRSIGCSTVAILPALPGEETGHADLIAQFVDSGTVVVAEAGPDEPDDVAVALAESVRILTEAAEFSRQPLEIVRVPLRVRRGVFYSYVNFTRLPGRVLVPSYPRAGVGVDALALEALAAAFGPLPLVSIRADKMAARGGAIHCLTLGVDLPREDLFEDMRLARRAPLRRRWIGTGSLPR